MRTCEKNKVDIWYTSDFTIVKETDEDGFFTGSTIKQYEPVKKARMNLYPANGLIIRDIFGQESNFDAVCTEMGKPFTKDTLIFLTEPATEQDITSTYDFMVDTIRESINNSYYGLKRRV